MIHATCDFCGHTTQVIRTSYGTSHYVRLICAKCRKQIEHIEGVSVQNIDETEYRREEQEGDEK